MNNKTNKPVLDPIIQKFVDTLAAKGGTPLYELSPEDARKFLLSVQAVNVEKVPADIEKRTIPVGPKGSVKIQILRPKGNAQTLPVIIYIHGAGWVMGDEETHDRLVREIVNGTQAAMVFVDYIRAPEGQYPVAHEEGYAAAKWVSENAKSLNVDASRMAIVGDSVGGLMATAIAMMAQERGGPKFIFQALFYPTIDAKMNTASYEQFAQGPWLTKKAMEWFWDMYVPDKTIRSQHLVSPINATLEQLRKLPPTLIIVNENDVLRDEGEAYARKLMEAGVPVAAFRNIGMIHDCMLLNAITKAHGVRAAILLANQIIINALAK